MVLDTILDFNLHLKNLQSKVNKTIGLLCKRQNILPRESLVTIYKSFIRPQLDYEDLIHDRVYNSLFHQSIESIHYNATLAITDAIRGTLKEKIYQEALHATGGKLLVPRPINLHYRGGAAPNFKKFEIKEFCLK